MDEILETFFENHALSDLIDYADDQSKIFNYIKKLAAAIFLIYATKAREHIFKSHLKEFALERYLQEEDPEARDALSEPAPPAAPDETDNDT